MLSLRQRARPRAARGWKKFAARYPPMHDLGHCVGLGALMCIVIWHQCPSITPSSACLFHPRKRLAFLLALGALIPPVRPIITKLHLPCGTRPHPTHSASSHLPWALHPRPPLSPLSPCPCAPHPRPPLSASSHLPCALQPHPPLSASSHLTCALHPRPPPPSMHRSTASAGPWTAACKCAAPRVTGGLCAWTWRYVIQLHTHEQRLSTGDTSLQGAAAR